MAELNNNGDENIVEEQTKSFAQLGVSRISISFHQYFLRSVKNFAKPVRDQILKGQPQYKKVLFPTLQNVRILLLLLKLDQEKHQHLHYQSYKHYQIILLIILDQLLRQQGQTIINSFTSLENLAYKFQNKQKQQEQAFNLKQQCLLEVQTLQLKSSRQLKSRISVQLIQLFYGCIVIGTPGRLLYHLQNTKGFSLKNLQFLVFDEADKLLNMDFEKEINQILELIPQNRTTFLFSATMTNKVNKLQRASLKNPSKIEVSGKYQTVSTLVQNYIFIPAKEKDIYLVYLLTQFAGNQIIIFCSTVATTQRLYLILKNLGLQSVSFHGQMSQVKRLASLNKFKSKQKNILICTEVGSRGLDIPLVDLVINFDVPQHSKDYIHRVGRTARAGKGGRAITIVTQYDVENLQKIEHAIGKQLSNYKVEENQAMMFQQTVQEAQKIVNREIKLMVERKKDKYLNDEDEEEGENPGKSNVQKKTKKIQKFNKKKSFKKK